MHGPGATLQGTALGSVAAGWRSWLRGRATRGPGKAAEEVARSSQAWLSTAQGELGIPGEGRLSNTEGPTCNHGQRLWH